MSSSWVTNLICVICLLCFLYMMFYGSTNKEHSKKEIIKKELPAIKPVESTRAIINLTLQNKNFSHDVRGNQVVCVKRLSKELKRIWATSFLKINSNEHCNLYEDVNAIEFEKIQKKTWVNKFLMKLNPFQNVENGKCNHYVYFPLYKKYCINIELDGQLDVEYVYTDVDIKMIAICLIGILLWISSEKLSRNDIFHFFSGVSLGVVGSILIFVIIILKFIPQRSTAILTLFTGSSIFLFLTRWVYYNFKNLADTFQTYVIYYIVLSGILAGLYCYYRGPIKNPRTFNIIEILLKLLAIVFIYCGTSFQEIFISLMISFFLIKLSQHIYDFAQSFRIMRKIKDRFFPPKRRLLTTEEFYQEGQEYTAQALKELKEYCKSPDCNAWKIISRVKNPEKLARFIEDENSHLDDQEIFDYERYSMTNDLIDEDDTSML